jgi:hypothetical protein
MIEFITNKPTENSDLEIVFDEVGAKQLVQLIEDCFKTGHEHLLPLNHGRWALTISGPNSFQSVTLSLLREADDVGPAAG